MKKQKRHLKKKLMKKIKEKQKKRKKIMNSQAQVPRTLWARAEK